METTKRRNEVYLKPYNHKELVGLYEISPKVFNTWLKPIKPQLGMVLGRCFTVKQVKLIFETFGVPGQYLEIPGFDSTVKIHPEAIKKYAELSWDYTYSSLLYRYSFNEDEIAAIKNMLVKYYESISPENFSIFAKNYYDEYGALINKVSSNRNFDKTEVLSMIKSAVSVIDGMDYKLSKEQLPPFLNPSARTIA